MTRRLQSSYSKSFPSFVLSLSFKSIHFCTIRFIAMFLKVCMHVIILLRLAESSLTAYYTFISSIFHNIYTTGANRWSYKLIRILRAT